MVVNDKKLFRSVDVSLGADVSAVNMQLDLVSDVPKQLGLITELSPTDLTILTTIPLRAGGRFCLQLKLPSEAVEIFALVRRTAIVDNGTDYRYAGSLVVIGATKQGIVAVIKFLADVTRTNAMLANHKAY